MTKKYTIKYQNLAYFGAILAAGLMVLPVAVFGAADAPLSAASDQVPPVSVVPPGFYQFNNLTITVAPASSQAPAQITATQKSAANCSITDGSNPSNSLPCPANISTYIIQIDSRTTLLGVDRNPAVLSDFQIGDSINVLGWVSSDFKTINAAVVRNLESKKYHQTVSGVIQQVTSDGFVIVLDSGSQIKVTTPVVGAQLTVTGVFDQANSLISDVISILIAPTVPQVSPSAVTPAPAPAPKAPSTLFKNFLRVFGL